MNKLTLLISAVICLLIIFLLTSRTKTTETNFYRLMDHFQQIEFVQTPQKTAQENPAELQAFLGERLNHDFMLNSSENPLKLKVTKSQSGPGDGPGLRTENVIFAPPKTTFRVALKLGRQPSMSFGYGLLNENWDTLFGGVMFQISIEDSRKRETKVVFREELKPGRVKARSWYKTQLNLQDYANKRVKIIFDTFPIRNNSSKDLYSAWVNPVITNATRTPTKPNLILISLDTLRADHLGCYGYPKNTTPHIDKLARQGVVVKTAISQAPFTMSSHMSLLTSLYPSFHGVNKLRDSYLDSKVTTLAEALYNQGYRTWAITGGGQLSSNYGFAEGFETFIEYNNKTDVERKVKETIGFLDQQKNNNFFVFFHTFRPHAPYRAPAPYNTMFDPDYQGDVTGDTATLNEINSGKRQVTARDIEHIESLYDGDIRHTDEALAPLFDYLRSSKLDSNTLIVITSDHGEEFGEHGKVALHSHTLYDELLQIPLILVAPKLLPSGKVLQNQVRSIDIAPTILELFGVQKVEAMQGSSLVNLIRSGADKNPEHYAYSERLATDNTYLRSVRSPSFKFICQENRDNHDRQYYYFNLQSDPHEQKNIDPSGNKEKGLLSQIQFLIDRERTAKKVVRERELDNETLETLKALGYVN